MRSYWNNIRSLLYVWLSRTLFILSQLLKHLNIAGLNFTGYKNLIHQHKSPTFIQRLPKLMIHMGLFTVLKPTPVYYLTASRGFGCQTVQVCNLLLATGLYIFLTRISCKTHFVHLITLHLTGQNKVLLIKL